MQPLTFHGHQHFRSRLVLSILSGRPVRLLDIRTQEKNPGLCDFEISLLRLIERITNGSTIEISVTGTAVLLNPGIISGGALSHDCPLSRSLGYFLEPLIQLAPFSKQPFQITLRGITTDHRDLSVDLIRTVTLPYLQLFGISQGLELRIEKRGSPPAGGGQILFSCPVVKQVKTLNFIDPGRVKRIRGVAHAVRVSPQFTHRMIESSRSILNRYIPDIYIYSDVFTGPDSGKSPGYALSLLAETTTSAFYSAEAVSKPGISPEDIGLEATRALLDEINKGGCIDEKHQSLILLFMVLASEDVGRCRMGLPSPKTVQFFRDVQQFFGTSFKIVPTEVETQLLYSCYGIGHVNTNRTLV